MSQPMNILELRSAMKLHKNARTTPAMRREIQASSASNAALAKRYSIDVATVRKWRNRDTIEDVNSRPHSTQSSLTPHQQTFILGLRHLLCLPLDDLLTVARILVKSSLSRAVVNRLLKRHAISKMSDVLPLVQENKQHESFKKTAPGTVQIHVQVLENTEKTRKIWVYAALERNTRCFFVYCFEKQQPINPIQFLQLLKEQPLISFGHVLLDDSFLCQFSDSIRKNILNSFVAQGIGVRMMQYTQLMGQSSIILPNDTLDEIPSLLSAIADVYHHSAALHSLGNITPAAKAMALRGFDPQFTKGIIDNVLIQIKSSSHTIMRIKKSIDVARDPPHTSHHIEKTDHNTGAHPMANANETIINLMKIEGAIAAVLADADSGMVLAAKSNGFDTDSAAAGNTRVVQAKRDTMRMLGLHDKIEDILITLGTQLHLITPLPSNDAIFGYLVVDKKGANLGMARAQLKSAMASLTI